jgi:hypothetical protein
MREDHKIEINPHQSPDTTRCRLIGCSGDYRRKPLVSLGEFQDRVHWTHDFLRITNNSKASITLGPYASVGELLDRIRFGEKTLRELFDTKYDDSATLCQRPVFLRYVVVGPDGSGKT